jgi:tetraprenyl-beta-curcumene synthase
MPASARQPSVPFTIGKLAHYYARLLPHIRRCIKRWDARASAIPTPELRRDAVQTLTEKRTYVEAAAAFATLAPSATRAATIELIVAWQIISDYVDALGEQPNANPFANNMQLHTALVAAVNPDEPPADYYAHHAHRDDGGYLDALIAACRHCLRTLPLGAAVQPLATAAAQRCREAQSHVHAIERAGATDDLRRWTAAQAGAAGYSWWEVAAAGISGIAIPPLLGAAADPETTPAALARVHDAYWPHICALSVLLDGTADQDVETDGFSFIDCYPTDAALTEALARTAGNANRAVSTLPRASVHQMIVASTAAYYMTHSPGTAHVAATLRPVYDALRPTTALVAFALKARDRLRG